jgi:hypothetical protein
MRPDIELYIDEIVLHGLAVHDRYAIAEAVQHELTRMFTEGSVPSMLLNGREVSSLNAGLFHVMQHSNDGALGKGIANTVYKGFADGR